MPFVKLDCGILNSTIWFDRDAREVFLTALLMAEPRQYWEPQAQIEVNSLKETGWVVPPGWYGFVPAAGPGIVGRAQVPQPEGLAALERLGAPEAGSRSTEHEGRRLVRIDGGYLVLNYMRYREYDYTAAERSRRYRQLQKERKETDESHAVTGHTSRDANAETMTPTVIITDSRRQIAENRKKQKKTNLADPDFEQAWLAYPKRPNNSKSDALKQWSARRKEGVPVVDMLEGTKRYAAFCLAEKIEGKYIKQAVTFYGPGRHWESDYTPSRPVERSPAPVVYQKYTPPKAERTVGMSTMADEMEKLKAKLGIGGVS